MADSSGSIASFDIVVTAPGAVQAQSDAVGAFQSIGSAATSAAASLDTNTAATQRNTASFGAWFDATTGISSSMAALSGQTTALSDVMAQLNGTTLESTSALGQMAVAVLAAYGAWRDGEASLDDERLLARAGIIQQTTADLYAQADAERAATEATVASMSAVSEQTNLYNDSRAIVLAHMQAMAMDAEMTAVDAAANTEAAAAVSMHGLGISRIVGDLGSLGARLEGVTPMVGRFGSMIAGNVVGFGAMIGIMLAIDGALYVFNHMQDALTGAQQAQDALTAALEKWYATQQQGVDADRAQQIEAESAKVQALSAQYERLAAMKQAADNISPLTPTAAGRDVQAEGIATTNQAAAVKTQLDQATAALTAGEADYNSALQKAIDDRASKYVTDLSNLVKGDHATQQERDNALALLKDFQQQLSGPAANAPADFRIQLQQWADTLTNALKPALDAIREPLKDMLSQDEQVVKSTEAYVDHAKAIAAAADAEMIAAKNREYEIDKIGQEGLSLAILTADHTQEVDAMKAMTEYTGAALQMRLQTIQANHDAAIVVAALTDKLQAQADMEKQVAAIGAQNVQTTTAQTNAEANRIKSAQHEQDQLVQIALQGTERILSSGLTSWQRFFDDLVNAFQSLLRKMEQDAAQSGLGSTGLTALGAASAGLAGGLAGYNVGSQTTNEGLGALGGAAAGALAGAEIGSIVPGIGTAVGAVIGGLTGLVGGLLGSADKIKQLREQLQQAEDAYVQHLQTYPSQYASTFAQITEAFQQLEDAAKKAHTSVSSAAAAAEQQAIQQNTTDFLDSLTQRLNALNGAAGSYTNQMDALVKQFDEDEQTIAALNLGAAAAAQALQILNESIQQVADAAKAASDATTATLQERLLKDQGDTQGALEVQQAQELAQAIAQGMSPDQLQLLEQAQRMELLQEGQKEATQIQTNVLNDQLKTQQAALQAAQSNLQATQQVLSSLTQFGSSLPIGSLSTLSPADQLAAAKQQLTATYNAALGGDTTAAGNFSGDANSFLQLSQKYNASGQGYVGDYSSVQDMLNTLTGKFGAQESLQQQMVDALQTQITAMQSQLDALNAINQSVQALKLTPSPGASPGPSNPGANGPNGPGSGPGGNNSVSGVPPDWNGQYGPQSGQGWSGIGDYLYDLGDSYFLIDPYLKSAYTVPKSAWSNPFVDSAGNAFGLQQGWFMAGTFTVPPYAQGGDFGGGLRLVGEQGPELEVTGPSRIVSNSDLGSMLANGSNGPAQLAELQSSNKKLDAIVRQLGAGLQGQNDRLDKLNSSLTQLTKQTQLNANAGRGRRA